jgi:type I restriction enzyme, S subunit
LKKMDYVTPEKYEELNRHSFTEGDIVMTKLGDPLGVSAIVKGIPSGLIVADLVRIRPSKVITKFLCYQLNSPRIQKYINEQQKGTTRPRVNLAMIRELPIYSPPIDEQNKIVELLEDHLSRLDAALLEVKQAKIKAAQFRRSLLQAAFTGNLGSGGTSFKSKLPDGWETKRLDEIADIVMGQSPPGSSYNEHGEGQPFFQGKTEFGEVHPTVRKYTTAGTKFAKAGDILMSVRAPVGPTNIADIDCVIGRGLAAIRAKAVVSQDYLRWSLKHLEMDIQSKGTGTTFDAITGETLRGTLVALPPIGEQHKIVELLQEHLSRLDASISLADSMERQSNGLRRSLLQAAFTGQLTKEVASV